MNGVQIHLMWNHFPIIGFVLLIPLLFWSIYNKDDKFKSFAVVCVVLIALTGMPAFFTGEPAEELIKQLSIGASDQIKEHEDAAQFALGGTLITALSGIIFLILNRRHSKFKNLFFYLTVFFTCFTSTILLKTGHEGGLIRHQELNESQKVSP